MPADDQRQVTEYDQPGFLSEDEIVQLVRLEVQDAMGHDAHVLGDLRARALDFYHGNTQSSSIPAAPAGRSNIVSMDVHDSVNSLLAEILPMLKSSMVEFPPHSEQDEPIAQMESDFIAHKLEEAGFDEIAYSASHSALLQGLGWVKVEFEDYQKVTRQTLPYPVTDPLELETISRNGGEVSIRGDVTDVITTIPSRRLVIDCVAPENLIFSPSRGQYELEELRFVAERKLYTIDELVQRYGMTVNDASELPDHNDDYWPGMIARREKYYSESDTHQGGWQQQTRHKEVFCCYMDIAMRKDGPLEKWFLMVGGRHLIKAEPVPFQPWVCASPIPIPHRIMGRGMFETMKDVQEAKTDLMRSLVDNAMVANGSRTAYNENTVNPSQLTDGRINGVVGVNGVPAEHLMQMPATDITAHMTGVLQYLDEVRSSRGGASVDMNDAELQTAQGSAEAAYNVKIAKEKMAGFYARNLINALLKGIYTKAHQTLRYYFNQPEQAKIRGNWIQTNPSQWSERPYAIVNCGMTEIERRQKIHSLTFLIAAQREMAASGGSGIITDVSKMYNAVADWVRVSGVGQPEEYLLDPMSPESQQVQQQKSQEAQQRMDQAERLMDVEQQLKNTEIELDKYKFDKEQDFKKWEARLKSLENLQDNQTKLIIADKNAEAISDRASSDTGSDSQS